MTRNHTSWVVRALTILLIATLPALLGGISPPATATEPWNPPAIVTNDPAGTTQDWYQLVYDGKTGYSYDPSGSPEIGNSKPISTGGLLSVTVYAKNPISGEVRPQNLTFTDAAGVRAPNTVTLHTDQMVCGKFSTQATWLPVTWTETYDGTGLTSSTPGVFIRADNEVELEYLQVDNDGTATSPHIRPDGSTIRLDEYTRSWVGLLPGWYTAIPYRLAEDRFEFLYEPAQTHVRLWVPPCGGAYPPTGQVPPGGVTQTDPVPEPGDAGTTSGQAAGKLRLLRKIDRVLVKAINRKGTSRSTFKLIARSPARKGVVAFTVLPGKAKTVRVKATASTTYVLKVRVMLDGALRYKPLARLKVDRL